MKNREDRMAYSYQFEKSAVAKAAPLFEHIGETEPIYDDDVSADPKRKLRYLREIRLTQISICLTVAACLMFFREILGIFAESLNRADLGLGVSEAIFALIVGFLIYGNLVYQFARLGYMKRLLSHRSAPRQELDRIYDDEAPALAILVPSYKEETRIVKQTLLSAALQEYPNRRVVLLIDDPPTPRDQDSLSALLAARALPQEVQRILDIPAAELEAEFVNYSSRKERGLVKTEECLRLATLYNEVAAWFAEQAQSYPIHDHTDMWFVKKTFEERSQFHFRRALEMELAAGNGSGDLDDSALEREYKRLASLFKVELTVFERKRYANLSHEANKAMNLNSYIGIMGRSHRESEKNGSVYLEHSHSEEDIFVPDADYLITLDADSILLPEYALRLIHVMNQPGNERLAVIQTPYNAIPNPAGELERIAGATTDIQYIIHQGFTRHNATYWVGANALLRKKALEDIRTEVEERGFRVTRYIQDRTVIEDTESSIDLIHLGWELYNYPERLAYSATPPDFGSLLIQRRRWSNGGLIIAPKLFRYFFKGARPYRRTGEGFMRFHYLISITGVSIGLLLMLLCPFEQNLRSVWLPLTAIPYYFFYGRDLMLSGYKVGDLFRVYALNLLLLPVNLGGVLKSIQQAWTGEKIPFKRTPKVTGRTVAPALYILAEYAILLYCASGFIVDCFGKLWLHAVFTLLNGGFLFYAVRTYIGFKEGNEDVLSWARTLRIFPLRHELKLP
jgi:cellulose synthase/poly-beta-1,6-N-acetylglucosamine synthase-like glycosyltransferase